MSTVMHTSVTTDDGQQFITVFADGTLLPPIDNTHPNFEAIKSICRDAEDGADIDVEYLTGLFDVAETIRVQFERLSDRVSVKNGVITLDGDPVHGTLQEQILQFLDAGEDFAPLVEFYEKLLTNPLGDVREGLYDWINGQRAEGNFTITTDGDILGYKSCHSATPEWRTDESVVYVPSRRGEGVVNGRDVQPGEYIEQVPGDVVEMPRSRVLHAPSRECGDGLHIGTYHYAKGFQGDTVLLVQFSPRDIVSLPDSNASWKLRVCRYTVVGAVDGPLEVPVWSPGGSVTPDEGDIEVDLDLTLPAGINIGDRVIDSDGDEGVVLSEPDSDDEVLVEYDDAVYGQQYVDVDDLTVIPDPIRSGERVSGTYAKGRPSETEVEGTATVYSDGSVLVSNDAGVSFPFDIGSGTDGTLTRVHGKGGPTSQAAKGNGRNPAQDEKGRFSNGRPGSQRDSSTGRFVG